MTQLKERERELAGLLSGECRNPQDVTSMLKRLFTGTLEQMLEAEMDEHLGYVKNSAEGNNSGNSRNGYNKKTLKSEWGEGEISVPRDRNGEFKPKVIENRQTRTDDVENRILAMYAKGMSTRDIEDHLRDIYGVEASASLISRIKDLKAVMTDLKKIYGAVNEEAALYALEEFRETWGDKYPQIIKTWEENWSDLLTFFKYPSETRRLIYTTNAVEGFHRMLRKFTKTKTVYPTDDSLRKSIYLSIKEISRKWSIPVKDWGIIIGQFMIFFDERFRDLKAS